MYKIKEDTITFALKILRLWEVLPNQYSYLIERFQREYTVGQIESDSLTKTFYNGVILGNPYIVSEYCPGGTLDPVSYTHLTLPTIYSV